MFREVFEGADLVAAADRIASYVLGCLRFVRLNVGEHLDDTITERTLTTKLRTQLRVRELRHRTVRLRSLQYTATELN